MLEISLAKYFTGRKEYPMRVFCVLATLGTLAASVILLAVLLTATGIPQLTAAAGLAMAVGVLPYLCAHTGRPIATTRLG